MTMPFRRFPLALLTTTVIAAVSACAGSSGQAQGPAPASPASSAAPSQASGGPATPLVVPAGEGGGALSAPHTLTMPAGWTAQVWARVPNARMEAWTPEGDLNANPDDRTMSPQRADIMAVRPDGTGLRVAERGVRNGAVYRLVPAG